MMIDTHIHFWKLERGDYGWLTPDAGALYQDFSPEDIQTSLKPNGVEGVIAVQAAPTVQETQYLLSLCKEHDWIKGVVGWVDLSKDNAPDLLSELAQDPKLLGVRPMLQDIDNIDWILKPELNAAISKMIDLHLTFDALVLPRHLKNFLIFARKHESLSIVINHCAKPEISEGKFDEWADDMSALAKLPHVFCKISGLLFEVGAGATLDDIRPYLDHVVKIFGTERLIMGSDWPLLDIVSDYTSWQDMLGEYFTDNLSQFEIKQVRKVYPRI